MINGLIKCINHNLGLVPVHPVCHRRHAAHPTSSRRHRHDSGGSCWTSCHMSRPMRSGIWYEHQVYLRGKRGSCSHNLKNCLDAACLPVINTIEQIVFIKIEFEQYQSYPIAYWGSLMIQRKIEFKSYPVPLNKTGVNVDQRKDKLDFQTYPVEN